MSPSFSPTATQDSFADMLTTVVMSLKGKLVDGRPYWAYLAIKPSMVKVLDKALKEEDVNIEDYGTIIEWGTGDAPPTEIVEQMKNLYGVSQESEKKMLARIAELDKN